MTDSAKRTFWVWGCAVVIVGMLIGVRLSVRERPLERLASEALEGETTRYSGSWKLPRGGPYVLGFFSPQGTTTLRIDDRVVARGSGLIHARVVYPAMIASVEIVGPPGLTLLWHPPGRRGPLEYVPASSLSPKSPHQARFGANAGRAIGDGLVALAILLVVVAALLFTLRKYLVEVPRLAWMSMGVVFGVALIVRCIDLSGAGATWDEDVNWSAGRNYVVNVLELEGERDLWQWNFEHPPIGKYLFGVGALFADGYGPARVGSAVLVSLACAFLALVVRRFYGNFSGVMAGLIAAFSPHLIAHGKIVGHEATALLWWTLGVLVALVVATERLTHKSTRVWGLVSLGVVLALAIFSRFINVLLAPLVAVTLIAYADPEQRKRVLGWGLIIVPLVIVVVGYITWPRLWSAPIVSLSEAWAVLRKPHSPEFFLGTYTNQPPPSYFLVYLAAATPVGILALAAVWACTAVRRRGRGDLILIVWLLAPLIVTLSPVRQDGVRYILPSLLAVSAMAGVGACRVTGWIRWGRVRSQVLAAIIVCFYLSVIAWRVHPYYLDYYGEHVGGPRGVHQHKRFELAWWGEGLDRAIAHINEHALSGDAVYKQCVAPSHLAWLRHDLWQTEVIQPEIARWFIVYQPYTERCSLPSDAIKVFSVEVMGAPLAEVYRIE